MLLIRRRFRVKAMQFLYINYILSNLNRNSINHNIIEKNMLKSIDKIYDLYIYLLNLLLALRKKAFNKKINFKKKENLFFFDEKFINNILLTILSKNVELLNYNKKNKKLLWNNKEGYINFFFQKLQNWNYYKIYINKKKYSFNDDKDLIIKYYQTYIKYSQKIDESLEDCYMTWVDDIDVVHNMVINTLKNINSSCFKLYNFSNNIENKNFVLQLYRQTILNKKIFDSLISKRLNNWSLNRIAILDKIILHMALCEFIFFPNIPPKVTMNEYIEITKLYSTKKSKIFINGILNNIFQILIFEKKIIKINNELKRIL